MNNLYVEFSISYLINIAECSTNSWQDLLLNHTPFLGSTLYEYLIFTKYLVYLNIKYQTDIKVWFIVMMDSQRYMQIVDFLHFTPIIF